VFLCNGIDRMIVLDEQCDLLDMPALQQLSKDSKYAQVYRLLYIFLTRHLDAYLEFHNANAALLKNYGLVHEECITKMRLMSLTGLASKGSGEITYAVVREALKVSFFLSSVTGAVDVAC
jgi:translation initiation factor 3 subunit M